MKMMTVAVFACLWFAVPLSTQALTTEEILLLKQNGVSETTIQMMLQSEIAARTLETADGDAMGVRTIARPNGQPAIVYSTGRNDRLAHDADLRLQEERAWDMLRHLIVDTQHARD